MDLRSASSYRYPIDVRSSSPLAGLSVLVIDDNREAREGMFALLAHQGVDVLLAPSGRSGVELIEELGPDHMPDVLICDIAMPDQDGYVTLSRIREWEARNDVVVPIPAVAFTASALRLEKLKAMSYGFNALLTKPIVPERLYATLLEMARLRRTLTR
ncbi:MAG: sensory box protein [Rhodocyclales bacterium]|nr:sensory box protein [Rhodocyclales bacterium]MDB5888459.1 sensory box protein [Rhodocyclales bacterium]